MTAEVYAALAKAQPNFDTIHKGKTANVTSKSGASYSYNYAELADVLAATTPALTAQGIAVTCPIEDGRLVVRLTYGGESIESTWALDADATPQELGSQITYMRRYLLCALLNVSAEDDDDGAQATAASPSNGYRKATEAQRAFVQRLLDELVHHSKHAEELAKLTRRDGTTIDDLKAHEAGAVIEALKADKRAGRTPDGAVDPDEDTEPF